MVYYVCWLAAITSRYYIYIHQALHLLVLSFYVYKIKELYLLLTQLNDGFKYC